MKNFMYMNKFYMHKIAAKNLSEIYFLKNTMETSKSNNRDLNCDWIKPVMTTSKEKLWKVMLH